MYLVHHPPEDNQDKEMIYSQIVQLTWTPDPTKSNGHKKVVRVKHAGGNVYGKATGLYNKHHNDL